MSGGGDDRWQMSGGMRGGGGVRGGGGGAGVSNDRIPRE